MKKKSRKKQVNTYFIVFVSVFILSVIFFTIKAFNARNNIQAEKKVALNNHNEKVRKEKKLKEEKAIQDSLDEEERKHIEKISTVDSGKESIDFINSHPELYTPSLVDFVNKYPEATQFVLDYPKKHNEDAPIEINEKIKKGEIPLFLQWDERWGYKNYGDDLVSINGCGVTCLSMVACGLKGDTQWNPYKLAQFSDSRNFYIPGTGTAWEFIGAAAKEVGIDYFEVPGRRDAVIEALKDGHPIICSVRAGDFTRSGHFIVLTGVDENGQVTVNDPNSKLNSSQQWNIDRILGQTDKLWGFKNK